MARYTADPAAIVCGLGCVTNAHRGDWTPPADAVEIVDGAIELVRGLPDGLGLHRLHHIRAALANGEPLTDFQASVCELAASAIRRFILCEGVPS